MALSNEQVRQIAMLARLDIREDELAETVQKLSRILEFVDQLSQAATADVTPMAHPLELAQRLRPDQVTETNDREHIQLNAPSVEQGLYLVPKVIE